MGHVTLFCLFFKICIMLLVHVNGQHSVNDAISFRYLANVNHLLCLKIYHDCYMYNTTKQDQIDMHGTLTMMGVEAKVLKMVTEDRATHFKTASKDHYKHDLRSFNGYCLHGSANLWVYKSPVF
ncbi:uncharacterized protein LOC134714106 [Mytilus trossulus]|uniref:uncharacterized protein LOC134714106 n=1 Tax=Mytilus trossulus TaxID=6551 RepID=UPI00300709AA